MCRYYLRQVFWRQINIGNVYADTFRGFFTAATRRTKNVATYNLYVKSFLKRYQNADIFWTSKIFHYTKFNNVIQGMRKDFKTPGWEITIQILKFFGIFLIIQFHFLIFNFKNLSHGALMTPPPPLTHTLIAIYVCIQYLCKSREK